MAVKRRYGRPDRGSLLAMMAVNIVVGAVMLAVVLTTFGLTFIVPKLPNATALTAPITLWSMIWPMLPGAGICFACLWFWLVLVGRSRGVVWGGACVYGMIIALADVPLSGLILGTLQGVPLIGMLLGLAVLMMIPTLLLAIMVFGCIMGLFNGWAAQWWIEQRRRP